LLEAERPQRSRTRFIGIALAITSHFDDPLGGLLRLAGRRSRSFDGPDP
jgi:hypothetical protein